MPGAGALRDRWTFQQRSLDPNQDRRGPWEVGIEDEPTEVTWLRGTEAVMQDRLTGVQPVILTIRSSDATRAITPAWRAFDMRQPTVVGNVTGVTPSRQRGFLDILVTVGKAQG